MNIPFLHPPAAAERTAASAGLRTTLAFLAETDNEAAADVLIPALDSRFPEVRQGALEAILARPYRAGHRAVIARLHTIGPEERSLIHQNHPRMATALREAILNRDLQMCINGCQAAAGFRLFDVVPALVTALEEARGPRAAILGKTLSDLVDQLCRDVPVSPQSDPRRDPQPPHQQITGSLELSAGRFAMHHRREIVEAFVLLADCGNETLNQILEDPLHPAFVVLMEVFSKSTRGPILRLVLSYLYQSKAPSAVLSVVGKRVDPEFVGLLLRQIARERRPVLVQNLKRLGAVAWAHGDGELLDHLDGVSQRAAVRLVMLSGTSRAGAFEVVKHLLLRGEPEGRRAAAEALKQFQGAEANALTLEALDDEEPAVQAEALVQLRGRGIAEARARVVGMLDSPHASVRRAAPVPGRVHLSTVPGRLRRVGCRGAPKQRRDRQEGRSALGAPAGGRDNVAGPDATAPGAGDRPDARSGRTGRGADRAAVGGRGRSGPRRRRRCVGKLPVTGQLRCAQRRAGRPQPDGPGSGEEESGPTGPGRGQQAEGRRQRNDD